MNFIDRHNAVRDISEVKNLTKALCNRQNENAYVYDHSNEKHN